jgi:hypothetical protein
MTVSSAADDAREGTAGPQRKEARAGDDLPPRRGCRLTGGA